MYEVEQVPAGEYTTSSTIEVVEDAHTPEKKEKKKKKDYNKKMGMMTEEVYVEVTIVNSNYLLFTIMTSIDHIRLCCGLCLCLPAPACLAVNSPHSHLSAALSPQSECATAHRSQLNSQFHLEQLRRINGLSAKPRPRKRLKRREKLLKVPHCLVLN